jgi:hypothetical protein
MKCLFLLLLSFLSCSAADLSQHPFWKHYVGDWTAKGELKGQDGNTVAITERWTGKADGEDGFLIEGDRQTNNEPVQKFKWRISLNQATQVCEAILVGPEENNQLRFEASVSEVAMTLELKSVTGAGSSAITVSESFTDEKRDVMDSKVVFTNEKGEVTLEGTIVHTKTSKP